MDRNRNSLHLLNCWVCGMPYETSKRTSRCCWKPECRAMLGQIDTMLMLQFLLTGMRCYGGPGWELGERAPTMYPEC
jgi:hypothetical protein